jgi:hypothetical protein
LGLLCIKEKLEVIAVILIVLFVIIGVIIYAARNRVVTYTEYPMKRELPLDNSTIKKPMSYAEFSALTGVTIHLPEKDVNGNPFDVKDVDFSAMLDPSYPYNLKPQKSLSEKLYDLYLSCVRDSYNALDKKYFSKITKEYTLYPIVSAYAASVFCGTTSSALIAWQAPEKDAIDVIDGLLDKIMSHCDLSFSDMKEQKNHIFLSCQDAFLKIHAKEIYPRCLWMYREDFNGMMSFLVAFGDMLCSEEIAKDYRDGKPKPFIGYSIPPYESAEFGVKVMDAAGPIFNAADAIIAMIKTELKK